MAAGDPTWIEGEQERYLEFFRLRTARAHYQVMLEQALMPVSSVPYQEAQLSFRALVRDTEERRRPPDEEFEDSKVVKNVGNW